MKTSHQITLLLLALTLPLSAFGQKSEGASPNAETEKTLMKIEQDMSSALTTQDATAAESMLASNAYFVAPNGTTQTKAEFLADLKSGDFKLESNNLSDMKVQVAGADMAVVTYKSDDEGTYKGRDISGQYRWIDVLVKRDGRWQFVVSQGTAIADNDAEE
ncbi:MAG: nuclear transport factor 2 family protein [Verrucomicrobiota bacterium]|nr:nuclear transport factor 2 family protein [Verrucomicrobiota bacterium]